MGCHGEKSATNCLSYGTAMPLLPLEFNFNAFLTIFVVLSLYKAKLL
jgi:hypothetical protein